jgi:hypothetical protein
MDFTNVFKIQLWCSMYFIPFYGSMYSIVWVHYILFVHSPIDGHIGCFYILAIVNAAMNIHVHIFVWTYISNSLGNA